MLGFGHATEALAVCPRTGHFATARLEMPPFTSPPSSLWLEGEFQVGGAKFGVHHKPSEYKSLPAAPSGWSGGTLDIPWTCPIPIEPHQTPVFDQPSLSGPLSYGIPAEFFHF